MKSLKIFLTFILSKKFLKNIFFSIMVIISILIIDVIIYFLFKHLGKTDLFYMVTILINLIMSLILLNIYYYRYLNFYKSYKQSIDYISEYESIIEEQGKKSHEYNNQLMIISGYIDNKKKLKEYLSTIIYDYRTGQNYEIRQLYKFPKGGIKELLYNKIYKMII